MKCLKPYLLAALAVICVAAFASSAQAATIEVCPTSFPAIGVISAAVATAASGTTINVCPGLYFDDVVINQEKVKVIGQGKSGDVQVICNTRFAAFTLQGYDDYVQNMKISGCTFGVFIEGTLGGKDGVIRDNTFVNNIYGVVASQTTTATVQANTFTNNVVAISDSGSTSSDFGSNTIFGGCNLTTADFISPAVVNTCNAYGIDLLGASKASVNSNHITQVFAGVSLTNGTTGSKITNNKVWNTFEAFIMDQAGDNTVTGNEADTSRVGIQTTFTTGQDSINGNPNVIENNKAKGNSFEDLLDQGVGTEPDGVGNKWHKNTCGATGSSPASLCTD